MASRLGRVGKTDQGMDGAVDARKSPCRQPLAADAHYCRRRQGDNALSPTSLTMVETNETTMGLTFALKLASLVQFIVHAEICLASSLCLALAQVFTAQLGASPS